MIHHHSMHQTQASPADSQPGTRAVCHGQAGRDLDAALAELWRDLSRRQWLPDVEGVVAIQVCSGRRSPDFQATVRSLAQALAAASAGPVVIVDAQSDGSSWASWPVRNPSIEPAYDVACGAWPGALRVPALWFEPCAIVTVFEIEPSSRGRISGALEAQASILRSVQEGFVSYGALVTEADRLASSDLTIGVSSTVTHGDRRGWWVASPSSVAADEVISAAAGLDPMQFPARRYLEGHAKLQPAARTQDEARPCLTHLAAPRARMLQSVLTDKVRTLLTMARSDYRNARRNLHRIPGALRRRLPVLWGGKPA